MVNSWINNSDNEWKVVIITLGLSASMKRGSEEQYEVFEIAMYVATPHSLFTLHIHRCSFL